MQNPKQKIISMETVKKKIEHTNNDLKNRKPYSIIPYSIIPLNAKKKATSLTPYLCTLSSKHIRLFHITWITFFICFYSWFSLTNLVFYIEQDLNLTLTDKSIAITIQSLSTIIFRIYFGDLCDKIGARYSYTILLIISFISFLCISWLSFNNLSFQIFSFFIGIIGASFVITQYHVTQFFATRCVGVANALSAGWGNFGGGVTMVMTPIICNYLISNTNTSPDMAWRYTILLPCLLLFFSIFIYYLYTTDTPIANNNNEHTFQYNIHKTFVFDIHKCKIIMCDIRVWILALSYAVCFGIEVTVLNYFVDYFEFHFNTNNETAGIIAFSFSLLNIFARGLGGYLSDMLHFSYGIQGRVYCLFLVLLAEATFLFLFAFSSFHFGYSLLMMVFFSLYTQIAEGIVFAIVPSFPKTEYHGLYMGIVGAGGNFGAMIYAFAIFKNVPNLFSYRNAWIVCSAFIFVSSFSVLCIKFTKSEITNENMNLASDYYHGMENTLTVSDTSKIPSYKTKTKYEIDKQLKKLENGNKDESNDIISAFDFVIT